jgi:CRP/FNR family cyclic AMP-dependent transcriptional regulator
MVRDSVLERCTLRSYAAQETVFHVGDGYTGIFGLVEGQMKFEIPTNGGELRTAAIRDPVFWFGEIASFRYGKHTMTTTATVASKVLFLPHAEFEMLAKDATFCMSFALLLADHFEEAALAVSRLINGNAEQRVASKLCHLAHLSGASGDPITLKLNQSDLGEMCNLSRPRVVESLNSLAQKGLVKTGYRNVEILDLRGLEQVAQNDSYTLMGAL